MTYSLGYVYMFARRKGQEKGPCLRVYALRHSDLTADALVADELPGSAFEWVPLSDLVSA